MSVSFTVTLPIETVHAIQSGKPCNISQARKAVVSAIKALPRPTLSDGKMRVIVESPGGERTSLEIEKNSTVTDLIDLVWDELGVFRLCVQGEPMDDDFTLQEVVHPLSCSPLCRN